MVTDKTYKMAAVQMVSRADIDANLASAAALITEAAQRGASLVLLPENFAVLDAGPLRQYAEVEGDSNGLLQSFLSEQSKNHKLIVVGGTIPLLSRPAALGDVPQLLQDGRVRPACLVFDEQGRQLARYDKMHLFDVVVEDRQATYSESRSFEPGDRLVTVDTTLGRLGLSVCYDLRFPELYRGLAADGASLFTVPAAFTRVTGQAHWEPLLRARAIENQCYVIAAGQGGVHNEKRETWGRSMIIDPWGTVLDSLATGEGVAIASLDSELQQRIRRDMPVFSHRRL
ncbi:MAG: hypothetical protein RLZZ385_1720 [Pseudomonadota bacterium]